MRVSILILLLFAVSAAAAPIGGIQTVIEPAFRMPSEVDSFHVALQNELISWGDSLKTGEHGFMGILFKDGSLVKMAGNSEVKLEVPESEGGTRRVKMKFGDLWVKIIRADQAFEVETPTSVASVKGTKFWILVTPGGDSRLLCQEGLVDFYNPISGQRMFVSAGQMCSSGLDGSLELTDVNPEGAGAEPQAPSPDSEPPPEGGEPSGAASSPSGGATAPPPSSGGGGLGINGAVGATSINGENYQYFSLRPDISIWRFGIGLDLAFYFDSEGKLREEDWDEAADYIDKIYYLRYGKPGDPLFVRVGSLSPITLGYGLIMRRYTNSIEWPQVRRIGMQMQVRKGAFTFEGLVNNFREIDTPGLVGGRLTYEKRFILPVVLGGTFVFDGNQYLGVKDDDGDGVPNQWDMFPDINDGNHIGWLEGLFASQPQLIDSLIASGDLPDINNPSPNVADLDEEVMEWGVDIGVPLIRKKSMNLWVYAQMAQIDGFGRGYTVPGLMFNIGPFRAGAEYRIFEKQFLPEFFSLAYETERVVWDDDAVVLNESGEVEYGDYVTKKQTLEGIPDAQGYYVEAGLTIMSLLDVFASYQEMAYGGGIPGKTLYGMASLNTSFIPKLDLAEAYYQQPNADDIFKTKSDGTVTGYKLGIGLGGGVMLVYDNKTIYYNGEPNRIMTIETAISF